MPTHDQDHAREQAAAQCRSITAMVAAYELDYDELENLKEQAEDAKQAVDNAEEVLHDADEHMQHCREALEALPYGREHDAAREAALAAFRSADEAAMEAQNALTYAIDTYGEIAADLDAMLITADGCTDADDARQRIDEDPLSVEIRAGWAPVGDTLQPDEFMILLCTGGPAVRIVGELDGHQNPARAWVEYSDWGTPWTEYHGEAYDPAAILTYCSLFYFGE